MLSPVSVFSGIVSELQTQISKRIPFYVMFPLALVVIVIGGIAAYGQGTRHVVKLWEASDGFAQVLLVAGAIIGFFFLANALAALDPAVSRLFQGSGGFWSLRFNFVRRLQLNAHRKTWQELSFDEARWNQLYQEYLGVVPLETRVKYGSSAAPAEALKAVTKILPYEPVSSQNAASRASGTAVANALTAFPQHGVLLARRTIESGAVIARDSVLIVRDATWFAGMVHQTIRVSPEDLPASTTAGQIGMIYDRLIPGAILNPGGSLILDICPALSSPETPAEERTVEVVLAVPPELAAVLGKLSHRRRLMVSLRNPPEPVPLYNETLRTRRWLPFQDASVGLEGEASTELRIQAGDVFRLTLEGTEKEPARVVEDVIFAEFADHGSVWAVPIESANMIQRPNEIDESISVRAERTQFNLFGFKTDKGASVDSVDVEHVGNAIVLRGGFFRIREGKLEQNAIEDPLLSTDKLGGMCLLKDISAGEPIAHNDLGVTADMLLLKKLVLPPATQPESTPPPCATFVVEAGNTGNATVIFAARVLTDSKHRKYLKIPPNMKPRLEEFGCQFGPDATYADDNRADKNCCHQSFVEAVSVPSTPGWLTAYVKELSLKTDEQILSRGIYVAFPDKLPPEKRSIGSPYVSTVILLEEIESRNSEFGAVGKCVIYSEDVSSLFQPLRLVPIDEIPANKSDLQVVEGSSDEAYEGFWSLLKNYRLKAVGDPDFATAELKEHLDQAFDALVFYLDQHRKMFRAYYPRRIQSVLPTAVGNVIASAHSYVENTYGMDATLTLPRLRSLLDEDDLSRVAASEERLSLLQWSGLAALFIGVFGTGFAVHSGPDWLPFLVFLVSMGLFMGVLYPATVGAAVNFSDQLRLMFDQERGKVMTMTGVSPPLNENGLVTSDEEQAVWRDLARWWEYDEGYAGQYRLAGLEAVPSTTGADETST